MFLRGRTIREPELAADIGLDRMVFGQDYKIARFPHNFSLWFDQLRVPLSTISYFYF